MNSFKFLLFLSSSTLALKHAYLEALLHKAFDPLFGDIYVQEFLADNDFEYYTFLNLELWSRKALDGQASTWLSKLGILDFHNLLSIIYVTVNKWKDAVSEQEVFRSNDVVRECAMISRIYCNILSNMLDEYEKKIQVELVQEFIYLVYRVHVLHTNTSTSYFELLNETNEYLEKALLVLDHILIDYISCGYETVSSLAKTLLADVEDFPNTFSVVTNLSVNHAKEALRLVNLARNSDANVVEEMMIGNCSKLPSILNHWLKGKAKHILREIVGLRIFPLAVKSIEKTRRTSFAGSTYPVPLPISRKIQAMEKNTVISTKKMSSILMLCEEYRTVARTLHQLYQKPSQLADADRRKGRERVYEVFLKLCSDCFPPRIVAHFRMHLHFMNYSLDYHPKLIHFTNLPMNPVNGIEWNYLQNLATWINELAKTVPERERKEFMRLMLQFVTLEVGCLIPEEQQELMKLSVILMIDGGLETYYANQIK